MKDMQKLGLVGIALILLLFAVNPDWLTLSEIGIGGTVLSIDKVTFVAHDPLSQGKDMWAIQMEEGGLAQSVVLTKTQEQMRQYGADSPFVLTIVDSSQKCQYTAQKSGGLKTILELQQVVYENSFWTPDAQEEPANREACSALGDKVVYFGHLLGSGGTFSDHSNNWFCIFGNEKTLSLDRFTAPQVIDTLKIGVSNGATTEHASLSNAITTDASYEARFPSIGRMTLLSAGVTGYSCPATSNYLIGQNKEGAFYLANQESYRAYDTLFTALDTGLASGTWSDDENIAEGQIDAKLKDINTAAVQVLAPQVFKPEHAGDAPTMDRDTGMLSVAMAQKVIQERLIIYADAKFVGIWQPNAKPTIVSSSMTPKIDEGSEAIATAVIGNTGDSGNMQVRLDCTGGLQVPTQLGVVSVPAGGESNVSVRVTTISSGTVCQGRIGSCTFAVVAMGSDDAEVKGEKLSTSISCPTNSRCTPGVSYCENDVLKTCNPDGTAKVPVDDCSSRGLKCDATALACSDNVTEECGLGYEWQPAYACGFDKGACVLFTNTGGDGKCQPGEATACPKDCADRSLWTRFLDYVNLANLCGDQSRLDIWSNLVNRGCREFLPLMVAIFGMVVFALPTLIFRAIFGPIGGGFAWLFSIFSVKSAPVAVSKGVLGFLMFVVGRYFAIASVLLGFAMGFWFAEIFLQWWWIIPAWMLVNMVILMIKSARGVKR